MPPPRSPRTATRCPYTPRCLFMSASTFLRSVGACILPPGHRLADRAYIEPADLAGEPFISLMHGDRTRRRVDRIFEDAGVERDLVVETQYAITHCNLVTLGVGCSIVNPATAIGFVSQGQIGRASCRERVCQYVLIQVVAGSLKITKTNDENSRLEPPD